MTKDSGKYHSPVPFEGWISIDGTNINNPVLQAEDNRKYLTARYDRAKNPVGAVFLDKEADGIRRRTDFFDMTAFGGYVESMLEGGLYKEEQENDITRLWYFVTCNYEFDNARTILYARECGS